MAIKHLVIGVFGVIGASCSIQYEELPLPPEAYHNPPPEGYKGGLDGDPDAPGGEAYESNLILYPEYMRRVYGEK